MNAVLQYEHTLGEDLANPVNKTDINYVCMMTNRVDWRAEMDSGDAVWDICDTIYALIAK